MDIEKIDGFELQKCLLPAVDFIVIRRVAQDFTYNLASITAERDLLEQRVLQVLKETDATEMPAGWSWITAARELSVLIVLEMAREEEAGQQEG